MIRSREYYDVDEGARREAIDERRARFNGCKCGGAKAMTLAEIRTRHNSYRPFADEEKLRIEALDDREQLLAWLDAALPYVKCAHNMSAYSINQSIGATTLLKEMGVKP